MKRENRESTKPWLVRNTKCLYEHLGKICPFHFHSYSYVITYSSESIIFPKY